MKVLYLECGMGAAGDMLMAALYELLEVEEKERFLGEMNALGLPEVELAAAGAVKCGIVGTRITVEIGGRKEEPGEALSHEHEPAHEHRHAGPPAYEHAHFPAVGLSKIEALLAHLPVSPFVREHAVAVYRLIAEAEAAVHGRPVERIHFHEIGQMDAVADIVGVAMLLERLRPERIVASSVHVGTGHVHTAHGLLPVPAPATARLLQGIPCHAGHIRGELCTPTGAALLRHFVSEFRPMPPMRVEKLGYGMGSKDFAAANCLRAFWGESADETPEADDTVAELCCNLDDMSGEAIGHAAQTLLKEGALDVFTTAVQMKKGRPGVLLTCLCAPAEAERFAALMLRHTTSFGVRKTLCARHTLARSVTERPTRFGAIRVKSGEGYGIARSKPEYEDVAAAAERNGLSFADAARDILKEDSPSLSCEEKKRKLAAYLKELESVAVAFSGGVDSTFLLKMAHDALGDRALAVTARSSSFPERELNEAIAFCEREGIRHVLVESEELRIEGFADNPVDRCYLCKTELMTHLWEVARAQGIKHVVEGSNMDDVGDYRPGLRAIDEQKVKSPLRHARLGKAEIRLLSKELGLATWDKPSFACLASRIPYGDKITEERLRMIDRAERFLLDRGLKQVRVRLHGKLARIETDGAGMERLMTVKARESVYQAFKAYGFSYVSLDLKGYRTGSMNETLAIGIERA
ncbi:MAG: nickel pincer cofactor biosynthesis protein LarC [Zoogloeaceae bacterium]|jgi:uncharacterized protein (TIGR00299 family) protein/uncharacterized protein (TIGR00268 family)|nr:nickel pincer cofactor biosynthesis protein LarC [Zoogloeaceae bacterium]